MDDTTSFERSLSDGLARLAGPLRPVDALAIARSVATQPTRGFTLLSAARLIAATVIVALFGGFLLAGVLTTPQRDEMTPAAVTESPAPLTTEALLAGMVTEEVEPGVLHILNDGVRDLTHLEDAGWGEAVLVDSQGMVWRFVQGERYFRLGAEEEWLQPTDLGIGGMDFVIADGRVLSNWDRGVSALEAQPDGTLWLLGEDGSLVREPPDGVPHTLSWRDVYDGEDPAGLAVTSDGDVWLMGGQDRNLVQVFLHYDGHDWEAVPVPDGLDYVIPGNAQFDVGPDGTLWTTVGITVLPGGEGVGRTPEAHRTLTRLDDSGWTIFGEADGVRPWGERVMWGWQDLPTLRVAPDRSAWVVATGPGEDGCGGLGRFDGKSWSSHLADLCITYYDIAPDGAVWVVAAAPDPFGGGVLSHETYVITPEAVTASR